MEEETELVTIPLSKYNQMLQELANLKIFREQEKEEIKKNAEKPYENLIGPNKDYVGYLAREFGNISSMVEYYQGRICALEHNLEESKNEVRNLNNKLKFSIERENRLLNKYNLIINERSTKWYQIIKRIKIRKEMKKLQNEEQPMPTTIKRIVSVLYRARTNKYEVQAVVEKNGRPCVITLYYRNEKEARKLKKGDVIDGNN